MTREQVDEAYRAYQKLLTSCELVDMRHTEALATAARLGSDLAHCERQYGPNHPHYRGIATVGGQMYNLSAWWTEPKKASHGDYLRVKFTPFGLEDFSTQTR